MEFGDNDRQPLSYICPSFGWLATREKTRYCYMRCVKLVVFLEIPMCLRVLCYLVGVFSICGLTGIIGLITKSTF